MADAVSGQRKATMANFKIIGVTLDCGDKGWLRPFGTCQFELVEHAQDAQQYNGEEACGRAIADAKKFTFGPSMIAKVEIFEAP